MMEFLIFIILLFLCIRPLLTRRPSMSVYRALWMSCTSRFWASCFSVAENVLFLVNPRGNAIKEVTQILTETKLILTLGPIQEKNRAPSRPLQKAPHSVALSTFFHHPVDLHTLSTMVWLLQAAFDVQMVFSSPHTLMVSPNL